MSHHPLLHELKGNDQPPESAVSVTERMQGLELVVTHCNPHQEVSSRVRMYPSFPGRDSVAKIVTRRRRYEASLLDRLIFWTDVYLTLTYLTRVVRVTPCAAHENGLQSGEHVEADRALLQETNPFECRVHVVQDFAARSTKSIAPDDLPFEHFRDWCEGSFQRTGANGLPRERRANKKLGVWELLGRAVQPAYRHCRVGYSGRGLLTERDRGRERAGDESVVGVDPPTLITVRDRHQAPDWGPPKCVQIHDFLKDSMAALNKTHPFESLGGPSLGLGGGLAEGAWA